MQISTAVATFIPSNIYHSSPSLQPHFYCLIYMILFNGYFFIAYVLAVFVNIKNPESLNYYRSTVDVSFPYS